MKLLIVSPSVELLIVSPSVELLILSGAKTAQKKSQERSVTMTPAGINTRPF